MYEKVPTDLRFAEHEQKTLQFWQQNDIFQKSIFSRAGKPVYTFYDGPPTANGTPHIGHVETRAIKDLIPRYFAMKGYQVTRKAGWDTHGLPVELEVEKLLGLDGKEQIESYGIAPFIDQCKKSVWKYKGMWEAFSNEVGFWADMDDPYVTYHNDYIESVWWSLKKVFDAGLLYKGYKVVPYCPRCGTPLSSHEVAQGYRDVKEKSAIAKFAVKGEDNTFFLAWTTTPWTLPSNVALCVHPQEEYVKAQKDGVNYYLAGALVGSVLGEDAVVLERMPGSALEFREYLPLFDGLPLPDGKCYFVTNADFVTLTDGTGIVHMAPAFGEDDSVVGRKYGLAFVQRVDAKGNMTGETPWAGVFCKKADALILKDLADRDRLFTSPDFEHSYPFCWRCDTPLIYYARESWYIEMTKVREQLLANNAEINWVPQSLGERRFGDWLENVQDWAISRNRYWGTPLPVWVCGEGHLHTIGSIEELKSMSGNCPDDIELHRPYIDSVTITCPVCGGEMHRTEEVIDCWYDSGAMPFAQWHYPFENKDVFDANFPADFISEAVDQTRGWFYSLLAISTLVFEAPCYKNCVVMGHVLDKDGQKMSKSKGNAVDPLETIRKHGADAVRWYFYENSAPWLPKRYSDDAVVEGQRKFLGTLWNTYAFYVLYAEIDGFDPTQHKLEAEKLPVMDRWLLSKLQTLIACMDDGLSHFRITEAARAAEDFVDELSNWYVRRCRERYWADGMEQDKVNAYMTLYTALTTLAKLLAPMIPFMTEDIYRNLVRTFDSAAPESVHLCDYPTADAALVDADLERNMDAVLAIVTLGRATRNEGAVKTRQPLAVLHVKAPLPLSKFFTEIVEDELNVKEVKYTDDMSGYGSWQFKPQLRTVGPKYGKQLSEIQKALAALDGSAAKQQLDRDGVLALDLAGGPVELSPEDLLIEPKRVENFVAASANGYEVAIDTRLTPELIEEGFCREIVSKLQTMRKDAGFHVVDRISINVRGNETISDILKSNEVAIAADVLAVSVTYGEPASGAFVKEWNLNGETVELAVKQV